MILGLHGKIGAGKNACAERLRLIWPDSVVEVSFAAKLKESAAALLGYTVADLELWKNDPSKVVVVAGVYDGLGPVPLDRGKVQTVRSFLQRYGTEAHRDVFGQGFWLDAALPVDRDYGDALYVVTDVRFDNEAERVRELGGVVVGIVGANNDTGGHASERPVRCDFVIDNRRRDDDFALLDRQLRHLVRVLTPSVAA